MTKFLRIAATEPDVSKAPFMIDSSKFEIIEAGLKNVQVRGRRKLGVTFLLFVCGVRRWQLSVDEHRHSSPTPSLPVSAYRLYYHHHHHHHRLIY